MPDEKIRAKERKLSEILSGKCIFSIPQFQRAYDWKTDQISQLWENIIENEPGYFLGTMVRTPDEEQGHSETKDCENFLVIDGQQRLTTLCIMLQAVFDCIERNRSSENLQSNPVIVKINEYQSTIASLINFQREVFDKSGNLEDTKPITRLRPKRTGDQKALTAIIEGNAKITEWRSRGIGASYRNAYSDITKLVDRHLKSQGSFRLKDLSDLLERIENIQFVVITCNSENDIFDLFEGLNATALALSAVDLVRNAILQAANRAKQGNQAASRQIEETWENIESLFGEEPARRLFNRFLRHYWISKYEYISNRMLFKTVKEEKLKGKKNSEVLKFVDELYRNAQIYVALRVGDYETYLHELIKNRRNEVLEEEIREHIEFLRLLGVDQTYEILLAYFDRYLYDMSFTQIQLRRVVSQLTAFSVRIKYIAISGSEYERELAVLCKDVSRGKNDINQITQAFYAKLSEKLGEKRDKEFIDSLYKEIVYKSGAAKNNDLVCRVLMYLTKADDPDTTKSVSFRNPTVEHIVPQNPIQWGLEGKDVEEYVNDLGNLTVLSDVKNKEAQNYPMDRKVREIYRNDPWRINKQLAGLVEEFTSDPQQAVIDRGARLKEIANSIWALPL